MTEWVLVRVKRSWVPDWFFAAVFSFCPTWLWPVRQLLTKDVTDAS